VNRLSKNNVLIKMNVHKIDSCFLSDGQSMINIINLLHAKHILIINGDERENQIMEVKRY